MDAATVAALLARRRAWRTRDKWTGDALDRHRDAALANLRTFATRRSPFYARHHEGRTRAPLAELPPVTKSDLMEHFDSVITVDNVRRTDLEEHLATLAARPELNPATPWHGLRIAATGGTTGRRGVFAWNRDEWVSILASYARANDWAGIPAGLLHRLPIAIVSTTNPTHQSAVVGASLRSPLVPTLRCDTTDALDRTVARLNTFQPRLLVGYATTLAVLAAEQDAGRLRIAPIAVMSASEPLTATIRTRCEEAWHAPVHDVYAATETAGIASPCTAGNRHTYDDLVIVENVDRNGHPVPDGTPGDRLYVTVLFSRTMPLIRYELTDSVTLGTRGCPCGRPHRTLVTISGRTEDTLRLHDVAGNTVAVHPNVIHDAIGSLAPHGWQIRYRPDRVRVLVVDATPLTLDAVHTAISTALARTGATPLVITEPTTTLDRTPLGKAPLIAVDTNL